MFKFQLGNYEGQHQSLSSIGTERGKWRHYLLAQEEKSRMTLNFRKQLSGCWYHLLPQTMKERKHIWEAWCRQSWPWCTLNLRYLMGLPGENVQFIVRNKTPELKRKGWYRKEDVRSTDIHLVIEAITMVKEKWAMDHSWEFTLEKLLGEEKPAEEITRDSKEREENLEKEIMSKQEKIHFLKA